MRERHLEMLVGLFMLLGLIGLAILAFQVSGLANGIDNKGYLVSAAFDNVGDLKVNSPVTISGVKVGRVESIQLDSVSYKAMVMLRINSQQNKIPNDSTASIFTQGLLGSNYISLTPGFNQTMLKNNDKITNTRPALVLENLIGQLLFKFSNPSNK